MKLPEEESPKFFRSVQNYLSALRERASPEKKKKERK